MVVVHFVVLDGGCGSLSVKISLHVPHFDILPVIAARAQAQPKEKIFQLCGHQKLSVSLCKLFKSC